MGLKGPSKVIRGLEFANSAFLHSTESELRLPMLTQFFRRGKGLTGADPK